jgi:hypothetical protein
VARFSVSGHELLPHLAAVREHLLSSQQLAPAKRKASFFDLEQLPYTIGAAVTAVLSLATTRYRIVQDYGQEVSPSVSFGLPDIERDAMGFAVDSFLEAARRSQNAVIPYLRAAHGVGLPMSMADVVSDARAGRSPLPTQVQAALLKYWEDHGRRLKDYRDLSQHFALLASDAHLFMTNEKENGIYSILPSNPEVKAVSKLVFGKPRVHAYSYVAQQFTMLLTIVVWLTRSIPRRSPPDIAVHFREPFTGDLDGPPIWDPQKVRTEMVALAAEIVGMRQL